MSDLLIVTDAWAPQVNGVVRTLENLTSQLDTIGLTTALITPSDFASIPCPTYPEVRLALPAPGAVGRRMAALEPDHIHIATEGPLGWAARRWCLATGRRFTTSYHTRFPEYFASQFGLPLRGSYAVFRRFHNVGAACMVASNSLHQELRALGFARLRRWTRGVDADLFRPRVEAPSLAGLPRPIFLSVGRIAVEKNLPAFLELELPGTKVVVGDGPALASLRARYRGPVFLGALSGEALAEVYAAADVFVFPSRTDTFGVVLLEALASGLPVAAFPVTGPVDVVGQSGGGVLGEDLRTAALRALRIPRQLCRDIGVGYSWRASAEQFIGNLVPASERIAEFAQSRIKAATWAAADSARPTRS